MSYSFICKNITKLFKTGENETYALQDIQLSFAEGDFISIIGPFLSGKSTLYSWDTRHSDFGRIIVWRERHLQIKCEATLGLPVREHRFHPIWFATSNRRTTRINSWRNHRRGDECDEWEKVESRRSRSRGQDLSNNRHHTQFIDSDFSVSEGRHERHHRKRLSMFLARTSSYCIPVRSNSLVYSSLFGVRISYRSCCS